MKAKGFVGIVEKNLSFIELINGTARLNVGKMSLRKTTRLDTEEEPKGQLFVNNAKMSLIQQIGERLFVLRNAVGRFLIVNARQPKNNNESVLFVARTLFRCKKEVLEESIVLKNANGTLSIKPQEVFRIKNRLRKKLLVDGVEIGMILLKGITSLAKNVVLKCSHPNGLRGEKWLSIIKMVQAKPKTRIIKWTI